MVFPGVQAALLRPFESNRLRGELPGFQSDCEVFIQGHFPGFPAHGYRVWREYPFLRAANLVFEQLRANVP